MASKAGRVLAGSGESLNCLETSGSVDETGFDEMCLGEINRGVLSLKEWIEEGSIVGG